MSTTAGPTVATIAEGSAGEAGTSLNPSNAGGDACAGTATNASQTTAARLSNEGHHDGLRRNPRIPYLLYQADPIAGFCQHSCRISTILLVHRKQRCRVDFVVDRRHLPVRLEHGISGCVVAANDVQIMQFPRSAG
jgi:hypothetical protein